MIELGYWKMRCLIGGVRVLLEHVGEGIGHRAELIKLCCLFRLEGNVLRGTLAGGSQRERLLKLGSERVEQRKEYGQISIELCLSQLALDDGW